MRKISVIGAGKTGGKVVEMLGEELHQIFDMDNPVTIEKLQESDAVIIFVPGNAVENLLPKVLEANIPAIWGSTGFSWPKDLDENLKSKNLTWIHATNFSLGMNVIRKAIQTISKNAGILKDPSFKIHEVHHVHKKDAPSGTAISWSEWLDKENEITSDRIGDVNGIHELTIQTETEKIELKHEALDRSLFAEGAIWAAQQSLNQNNLPKGFMAFSTLFDYIIEKQ